MNGWLSTLKNAVRNSWRKMEERIGTKDIDEIKKLVKEEKLLEAFLSIIIRIQWQLWANFHNKFHIDWKKIHNKEPQKRDINKLWKTFTKKIQNFNALIFLSYSTKLIEEEDYEKINELRKLRNKIAHELTYHENETIITKNKVKKAIDEGINMISKLQKIEYEIVFGRK